MCRFEVLFDNAGANVPSVPFDDVTPTFMAFDARAEQMPDGH